MMLMYIIAQARRIQLLRNRRKVIAQAPAAEQATAEQPAVPEATPAVQPASEMKQLNAISWIVTLIVAAVIVAVVIAYFRKRR